MTPLKTGLFWFTNDLRLTDHVAFNHAANQVDQRLCVYVLDEQLSQLDLFGLNGFGQARKQFLFECLDVLHIV